MIRREVLRFHSEAVATLGVQMQFGRFVSNRPFFVQGNTYRHEPELIIGRSHNKHRRRIRRNGSVFERCPARIDRSDEGWPAFGSVMEGDSGGDPAASGKSDNADTVGENSPFGSVLPNV